MNRDTIIEAMAVAMLSNGGFDYTNDPSELGQEAWRAAETALTTCLPMIREELAGVAERFDMPHDPAEKGYSYFSPDSGHEWSKNHPWRSGECPDAPSVERMTFGRWCVKYDYAPAGIASAIRNHKFEG